MKLVIEGPVATLYKDDKPILKISTKNDNLTAEVLDIKHIDGVGVSQIASVVEEFEDIQHAVDGTQLAPTITVQEQPPEIGEVVDRLCRKARMKGQ